MADDPLNQVSWTEIRDRLSRRLTEDARAGAADWLEAFAAALLASQFDVCHGLMTIETGRHRGLTDLVRSRFRPALDAARAEDLARVLERLTAGLSDTAATACTLAIQALANQNAAALATAATAALKAAWLEAAGESVEAGAACFEAAKHCGDLGPEYEPASIALLTRACELDPSHPEAHWYLADAWRLRSNSPTPPYVDRSALEHSVAAWNAGAAARMPDVETSWAYVIRSLISEQFARLDDEQRASHRWEAILYLERAIVLFDVDGNRWASLGRCHRLLGNDRAALHATAKAVEMNAEAVTALEERAAILADTGAFEEALVTIDKRMALDQDDQDADTAFALGVKAYILAHQEQYQPARELADVVIAVDPKSIWNLDLKATCCWMLGDRAGAREAYEAIERIGRASTGLLNDDRRTVAFALLRLDRVEEAMLLTQELSALPAAGDDVVRLLGLCHLARGEFVRAEETIARALGRSTAPALTAFLRWELSQFDATSESGPRDSAASGCLSRIRAKVTEIVNTHRGERSDARLAAEEELREVLRAESESAGLIPVRAGAARAGIARLQMEGGLWHQAAASYAALTSENDFPEAAAAFDRLLELVRGADDTEAGSDRAPSIDGFRQALALALEFGSSEQIVTARQHLGDRLWRNADDVGAFDEFQTALALAAPSDNRSRGDLQARMGLVLALQGERDRAGASHVEALVCYRALRETTPGEALARTCKPLLRTVDEFWTMDAWWRTLMTSVPDDAIRAELPAAFEFLMTYLDDTFKLAEMLDPVAAMPFVLPVALDVGTDIVPLVDPESDRSGNGKFINVDIAAMRERIHNSMGLPGLPGVRVRAQLATAEEYAVLLDGAAVATGQVHVGSTFIVQPDAGQIDESIANRALDPATGRPGRWYPPTDLKSETDYMLAHVELMLRRHFDTFLDVDKAREFLDQLPKEDPHRAFVSSILTNTAWLDVLVRVLRALLRESVPIKDVSTIIDAVEIVGLGNVDAAVRAIRLRLKDTLPGNQEGTKYLRVPVEWDSTDSIASVSPEVAHRRLVAARGWLQGQMDPVALVTITRDRPGLRRLIAFEFPSVPVLAVDEVVHPDRIVPADESLLHTAQS